MKSHRWVVLFAVGSLLVVGALWGVSVHMLRLEQREHVANAEARHQESIRLVLWRMDAALTPIIAREAARPYFEYRPSFIADRAFMVVQSGSEPDPPVASPLLWPKDKFVKLYYEQDASGKRTSPQIPSGAYGAFADEAYVAPYGVAVASERLEAITAIFVAGKTIEVPIQQPFAFGTASAKRSEPSEFDALSGAMEQTPGNRAVPAAEAPSSLRVEAHVESGAREDAEVSPAKTPPPALRADLPESVKQSVGEYKARLQAANNANQANDVVMSRRSAQSQNLRTSSSETLRKDALSKPGANAAVPPPSAATGAFPKADHADTMSMPPAAKPETAAAAGASGATGDLAGAAIKQGYFTPKWIVREGKPPELIFERDVQAGAEHLKQGIWLDWPTLKQMLLQTADGLLPDADLVPVLDPLAFASNQLALGRTLAAIPVELVTSDPAVAAIRGWTPARIALGVMWSAVLGAIVAAGASLIAAVELAQRRGRFVSAVTHELRTPLTTFCLYSQMLADGIVTDPQAQSTYFQTLKHESQRLARIVESVLDYARLSAKRSTKVMSTSTAGELLTVMQRSLAARCEQSGMTLSVHCEVPDSITITTDTAIVDRIIFNLIDNACKYAFGAEDKSVRLSARVGDSAIEFRVSDKGPGIAPADAARVFKPFARGIGQGSGEIPGLGLGLSIAKGLSRELGGDLRLEKADQGACFVLTLPLVSSPAPKA